MFFVPLLAFCATYVLMISLPKVRHWVAAASAVFFLVWGCVTSGSGVFASLGDAASAINWNVLMMLFGTMGTV